MTFLTRLMGGNPAIVLLRLAALSFVVGLILSGLGMSPWGIVMFIHDMILRIWNLGFDAVEKILRYFLVGAVVVVPIWIVMRLLSSKRSSGRPF
jgi:hypothetical protein